jgi:hydroxyacylglutathione hydrolase
LIFEQVLNRDLGCASYLLGDGGEAVVVDPRFDIDVYLEIADRARLRITHVLDTHDHADHVSGRPRLAAATGAQAYRAAGPGDESEDRIRPGQEITAGAIVMSAVATPGHRPEHLVFVVSDLARGADPWLVLTGDSLLVGDLARPDLVLEAEAGARAMYRSLRPLLELGDHVEVWPAHVGGSLCGGAGLSAKASSTIGYERRYNPLLSAQESEFVVGLTGGVRPRPPSVDRIVSINTGAAPDTPRDPAQLTVDELRDALRGRVTVLDARLPMEFDDAHLAGSINLPVASPGVGTRAGWVLDPGEQIVIVSSSQAQARQMACALHAVGLWETSGYVLAQERAWTAASLPVACAGSWNVEQLAAGLHQDAVELVDVRDTSEWVVGHVPGSHHLPLHRLRESPGADLPAGRTTAVACAGGIRAAFAASLLRNAGHSDVVRVAGGGVFDLPAHGVELAPGT